MSTYAGDEYRMCAYTGAITSYLCISKPVGSTMGMVWLKSLIADFAAKCLSSSSPALPTIVSGSVVML